MPRKMAHGRRRGQPRSRKGVIVGRDWDIKAGNLKLFQRWVGENRMELDPRYYLWPVADGMVRALKASLHKTGRASEATIKRRLRSRAWRTPPGRSSSKKRWLDSGWFRNTLEARWVGDTYEIVHSKDRLQTPGLVASLRRDVPIFGDAPMLARHPEVRLGAEETLHLLMTEAKGKPRKSR